TGMVAGFPAGQGAPVGNGGGQLGGGVGGQHGGRKQVVQQHQALDPGGVGPRQKGGDGRAPAVAEQAEARPAELGDDGERPPHILPYGVGRIGGAPVAVPVAGEVRRHQVAVREQGREEIKARAVVPPAVKGEYPDGPPPPPAPGGKVLAKNLEVQLLRGHQWICQSRLAPPRANATISRALILAVATLAARSSRSVSQASRAPKRG